MLKIVRYKDRSGQHRARFLAANGENIWRTSEGYKDKRDLNHAITLLLHASGRLKVEVVDED